MVFHSNNKSIKENLQVKYKCLYFVEIFYHILKNYQDISSNYQLVKINRSWLKKWEKPLLANIKYQSIKTLS